MNDRHWHLATANDRGELMGHSLLLEKPEVSGKGIVVQECTQGQCFALQYVSVALQTVGQIVVNQTVASQRIELPNLRGR